MCPHLHFAGRNPSPLVGTRLACVTSGSGELANAEFPHGAFDTVKPPVSESARNLRLHITNGSDYAMEGGAVGI